MTKRKEELFKKMEVGGYFQQKTDKPPPLTIRVWHSTCSLPTDHINVRQRDKNGFKVGIGPNISKTSLKHKIVARNTTGLFQEIIYFRHPFIFRRTGEVTFAFHVTL